jgi:hypothetical protein
MTMIMLMIWRSLGEAFEFIFFFHVEFYVVGVLGFGIADVYLIVG